MKDNFSKHSDLYSRFRPGYPKQLFEFLLPLLPEKKAVWDCGTGNGQLAVSLSKYFKEVYATDISAAQITNATKKKNIFYSVENTEETVWPDNKFDLISVAQAIHWFDFKKFYHHANRTLKHGGIIAIIGYDVLKINKEIDLLTNQFYKKTVGPYWDKERKHIDDHYSIIPFPFKEIDTPDFSMNYNWEFEQVIGYLNTWSAVQHYIRKNNENPVEKFSVELKKVWGDVLKRKVSFPVFMRTGRK
ncbi:MAG TPA: class I SAM-dependent methyltransferase [Ginsengibacter sp.]